MIAAALTCRGVNPGQVRWHNEVADTAAITAILVEVTTEHPGLKTQQYVPLMARRFLGKPYVASTLESADGVEQLTVNLDELDCTTFVETVIALAHTAADGRTSWRDYLNTLESIRYRRGEIAGYPSRLHYVSDWILDNVSRGNVTEETGSMPGVEYMVKTLDFMSSHRDSYPALADDENYAKIKYIEEGYRNHRYPYIKKTRLMTDKKLIASLKEGDIVALTTDLRGLDVSHFGIITIVDGEPHLLHASSAAGKVMVDPLTIGNYLKRSKHGTGLRVLRLPSHY